MYVDWANSVNPCICCGTKLLRHVSKVLIGQLFILSVQEVEPDDIDRLVMILLVKHSYSVSDAA